MKIYKYYEYQNPKCTNLIKGLYLNKQTQEMIGFGSDDTVVEKRVTEISEQDFIDWAIDNGGNQKEAENLLIKLANLSDKSTPKLNNKIFVTAKDVLVETSNRVSNLFSDPTGMTSAEGYQIKLMSQMIAILFAHAGTITYPQVGIPAITDKASADSYVTTNLLPLWLQTFQIKAEAEKYISDNKLE